MLSKGLITTGVIIVGGYSCYCYNKYIYSKYKLNDSVEKNSTLKIESIPLQSTIFSCYFQEYTEYKILSAGRVYTYHVKTSNLDELENAYKESLYGYDRKKHINKALQDYISKGGVINNSCLIIESKEWNAIINIENYTNPNTLVLKM